MGHFYDRTGAPQYTYNGRDSTLREARKFGWVPSVTEILQVVAKDALTQWMVKQGIMAALTGTRLADESDDAYIARILADSKQQAIDAANEGTRIHDACETYVRDGHCRDEYLPHAQAARAELARIFPQVTDWTCEQSFAHPLGYGGKCDLHSKSTRIIADYKTKDGDFSDGKKLAWDQHWQLAAYQVGLGLADPGDSSTFAPGAAVFISRTHPGAVASHVWSADEMYQGWRVFSAALTLWKRIKNFDPSFEVA